MISKLLSFFKTNQPRIVLQNEAAECGLACVAMLGSYYGLSYSISDLRKRFNLSSRGISIFNLVKIIKDLEMPCKALKVPPERLKEISLPAIMHWNGDHYVLLNSINADEYYVLDPAVGRRKLRFDEVLESYTGFLLRVSAPENIKNVNVNKNKENKFTSLLVGGYAELKKSLLNILVASALLELCVIIIPKHLQFTVDKVVDTNNYNLMIILAIAFSFLVVFQAGMYFIRGTLISILSRRLSLNASDKLFSKLTRLKLSFFYKRYVGQVVSIFNSFASIQQILSARLVQVLIDAVMALGTLGVMYTYNPFLPTITIIITFILVYIRNKICIRIGEKYSERILYAGKQSTHLIESVRSMQTIRLYSAHERRKTEWLDFLVNQHERDISIDRLNRYNHSSNIIIYGLERVLSIVILTIYVTEGSITLGMFFAYMAYHEIYVSRATSLIESIFDLRLVQVHYNKVSDVLLSEEEVISGAVEHIEKPNSDTIAPLIECKDISYRYSDFDDFILKNLNVSVFEGEILAIVGNSGAGKTTLIKIILGLLEPTHGKLNFKSQGISNINEYRKNFGCVMQDESLFMGSIQNNITFFSESIDEAWMIECAKMAGIHETIVGMPMAYKTIITNPHGDFSGGQRQRISLARAFYRRPKVLVLDEATSHLDIATETKVNESIKTMGITTILAAHRKETIALADRVHRI